MKKSFIALSLIFILAIGATGCGKTGQQQTATNDGKTSPTEPAQTGAPAQPADLKLVAQLEKELLAETEPQYQKIAGLFKQFNQGAINREKLNSELLKIKPEIEKIKQKSKEFYDKYELNQNDQENPVYKDGLKYGKKLRSTVSTIITTATQGKTTIDPKTKDKDGNLVLKKEPLNDAELKKYFANRDKRYAEYLSKLKPALEQQK